MYESKHSISLLFNANNVYDRQILEGIGHYLHTTKVDWDVFLEEDFRFHGNDVVDWRCDGLIANYDDLEIKKIVDNISAPVIGVGCSYSDLEQYPNIPYVASDNFALVESAFKHLKEKGLKRFAMYSVPLDEHHRWVIERERALAKLASKEEYSYQIYKGHATNRKTWHYTFKQLSDWIENLPKPIGIIAVNDARARHLLQACDHLGVEVPERVSIIGIDNDDLARNLSRISLSSVTQGCFEMGYKAAKLLHRRLEGKKVPESQVLVGPVGVEARQSTEFKALSDPYVIQAVHFIRQFATKGIKVDQVTDFVGISRSNLENRFQQEHGYSVHTAIHNEKLVRACKLLADSEMPINDIAEKCGYPSLQYMYSVFNKHFNSTPSAYRNENQKNKDRTVASY
ncbi:XylR family transcriptional regulator [Alteromonas mediterranea]|jgi:LacI family transcriptional regulator, galactose operon repressor|uniref:XylR family transcriptional regulator n=1 Tax=Alteromonas mediterranea TaxID=314275 RepID=UPI00241DED33|nr:DNA-binding transcriptional regulator [Alteromonas mediterranea]|tara:strand:+ start:1478 stop:2674 length:1197 start_codon:yes stop_codon:yes gene_type:complete